jgi:hypothetical protein
MTIIMSVKKSRKGYKMQINGKNGLKKQFTSRLLTRETKTKIYVTLVRPGRYYAKFMVPFKKEENGA